jgi:hypothetical protein
MALALLRDVNGVIELTVPVHGDRSGTKVDVGSVVEEALAHAIVNALASPLKLLGAVTMSGNKVSAFTPEPIACKTGLAEVAGDARPKLERLAKVLASYPALRFTLRGQAGSADARALGEAAVLADLDADKGMLATLRNLPQRGERRAIHDALVAHADGKSADLTPDQQATLEKWLGEHPISEADLRKLAAARAERVRTLLTQDFGVVPDRLKLEDPAVEKDGASAVAVGLATGH